MKTISIHGEKFDVADPYSEGHVITAAEAKSLNQTRAENIANNFRADVKKAIAANDGSLDKVRTDFADYDTKYNFTFSTPRVAVDPVEREARKLTKSAILAKIKDAKKDPKSYSAEQMEAMIEANWKSDAVMKKARKNVKERGQPIDLTDESFLAA